MKKNLYMQPKTDIVNVGIQHHLLAGSNKYSDNKVEINSATMNTGDGGDAASRGSSFWDDED